jgi:hypothetical protein
MQQKYVATASLMHLIWRFKSFVGNEISSLYSGVILKALICVVLLHKRPVEVLSRQSGAFSSLIQMAVQIASFASDGETYC